MHNAECKMQNEYKKPTLCICKVGFLCLPLMREARPRKVNSNLDVDMV